MTVFCFCFVFPLFVCVVSLRPHSSSFFSFGLVRIEVSVKLVLFVSLPLFFWVLDLNSFFVVVLPLYLVVFLH